MAEYKIKTKLAKKGANCRPGSKLGSFLGVTIHNTGNSTQGSGALNHANYLRGGGANNKASWHFAVDENYAYKSIPTDETAYHAGDGNGNGNKRTIAIEICMNSDGDLEAATDNAAHLTAKILYNRGIKKAVANKNVFQHNHWTGKDCPQMIRRGKPYSWAAFVKKVNVYLDAFWGKDDTPVTGTVTKPSASTKRTKAKKYAAKRKTIKRGSSNKSEIKKLQKLLKKLGFKDKKGKGLKIDGIWGAATEHAFAKAQKKYKLNVDKICGVLSWAEIYYRSL